MSDKVFVGRKVGEVSKPPAFDPITKVVLMVDDDNVFEAGTDVGRTLEATCVYATQAMAEALLAKVGGYAYRPLNASDALIDPSVELGDAITVDGVYTVLAQMDTDFDGLVSKLSAPGQEEIESEYKFRTKETILERKIAKTRSLITKTAEQIQLEVSGKIDGSQAQTLIDASISGIKMSVSSANGITTFTLSDDSATISTQTLELNVKAANITGTLTASQINADGLHVKAANITGTLNASQINADELHVKAANIDGTLKADQLNLTGSISFSDLDTSTQKTINSKINSTNATTLITDTLVSAPTIAGGIFADLSQNSYLEMGDAQGGSVAYLNHYYDGYSSSTPVCVMGYYNPSGMNDQWVLAPFFKVRLVYSSADDTMYAMGNWDFSQANVTGL